MLFGQILLINQEFPTLGNGRPSEYGEFDHLLLGTNIAGENQTWKALKNDIQLWLKVRKNS